MLQNCLRQNNTRLSLDNITKIFRYTVLPIYWAILTYMLLKPGMENQEYFFMFSGIDKFLHLGIFFFLGIVFKMAFPRLSFIYYFIITLFYASLTEILQQFMHLGRSMESQDLLADALGLVLAFKAFPLVKKILFK